MLPGISPITGSTEREALRLEKELEDLVIPAYGLSQLSHMTGIELTEDDLDGPLPDVPVGTEGAQSRRRLVVRPGQARRPPPATRPGRRRSHDLRTSFLTG